MGFTHDDGVYAVGGQSFAQGKGLRLMHVVGQPSEVKYPFLFPLLLAPVWFFQPHFPANLPALNAVSVGLTIAALTILYIYLSRCQRLPGWLSLCILTLVSANFFFLYFATLVMSEGAYMLFSLLTLWYVHRQSERGGHWKLSAVLITILLSLLTFHTRILGLAMMAAIGTWLLAQKQWKNALIYGAGCILGGVLPWGLWVKTQTPAVNTFNYPLVNAYSNYGLEFVHNYAGGNYFDGLRTDFLSLIARILESMAPILPNLLRVYPQLKANVWVVGVDQVATVITMYLLFGYFVLQMVHTLAQLVRNKAFRGDAFSIPALYLTYYLLIITLWNYEDQLTRFLVVITPLLWLYFFKPFMGLLSPKPETAEEHRLEAITHQPARWRITPRMVAVALIVTFIGSFTAPSSIHMISAARQQHWAVSGEGRFWLWSEYLHSFAWIRKHLSAHAPLGVASDVVYYLYTGRPTVYVFYASLQKHNGRFLPDAIPRLMNSLDHYGVRYLIAEPHMQARTIRYPVNRVVEDLLKRFPERFRVVYASPMQAIRIYEIVQPKKG